MNTHKIASILCVLACASCDKARELADKAVSEVRGKIAEGESAAPSVDPELAALVDETEEGVVFRKDLPFPKTIEVKETRRQEWSGRLIVRNEIESRVETLKGVRSTTRTLTRSGEEIRHQIEESAFTLPAVGDGESAPKSLADPFKSAASAGSSITLRKDGGTWKPVPAGDFRSAFIARELSPVMPELLVEHALAPRPLWFTSKKRFKPGDTLTVAGDSLPMLVAGKAVGELKLAFESRDAVNGHPCAVFTVEGDFTRERFPDFAGQFSDEEITIQSGKLWLSLIHPLVLREELDTIQSVKTGADGSPAAHSQGAVKVSITREWSAP